MTKGNLQIAEVTSVSERHATLLRPWRESCDSATYDNKICSAITQHLTLYDTWRATQNPEPSLLAAGYG